MGRRGTRVAANVACVCGPSAAAYAGFRDISSREGGAGVERASAGACGASGRAAHSWRKGCSIRGRCAFSCGRIFVQRIRVLLQVCCRWMQHRVSHVRLRLAGGDGVRGSVSHCASDKALRGGARGVCRIRRRGASFVRVLLPSGVIRRVAACGMRRAVCGVCTGDRAFLDASRASGRHFGRHGNGACIRSCLFSQQDGLRCRQFTFRMRAFPRRICSRIRGPCRRIFILYRSFHPYFNFVYSGDVHAFGVTSGSQRGKTRRMSRRVIFILHFFMCIFRFLRILYSGGPNLFQQQRQTKKGKNRNEEDHDGSVPRWRALRVLSG